MSSRQIIHTTWVLTFLCLSYWFAASEVNAGINEWTYVGLAPEEITDIEVSPTNPNTIYASALDVFWDSTREGGLFVTTNHGLTWDTLGFRHSNVFDIDIDLHHPDTLWLANGTAGIVRSHDGGIHWENRSSNLPLGGPDNFAVVAAAINPTNPNEVIASARGDMGPGWTYKTTNAGASWFNVDPWLTLMRVFYDSLVENRIYASSYNLEGVQISDDNGSSFRATPNINAVADIAPDPFQPNGIWVLRFLNFVYTPDTGATWIEPDTTFPPHLGHGQAVVVSPQTPGELFAAITTHVYHSTSGGASWLELAQGLPIGGSNVLALVSSLDRELWLTTSIGGIYSYTIADTVSVGARASSASSQMLITFPNPARDRVFISGLPVSANEVTLYNILGQRLAVLPLRAGNGSCDLRLPPLPAGKYFAVVGLSQTEKTTLTITITK